MDISWLDIDNAMLLVAVEWSLRSFNSTDVTFFFFFSVTRAYNTILIYFYFFFSRFSVERPTMLLRGLENPKKSIILTIRTIRTLIPIMFTVLTNVLETNIVTLTMIFPGQKEVIVIDQ